MRALWSSEFLCFSQGYGFAVLKPLYVYAVSEQISRYVVDNENEVFLCWKKELQIRKGQNEFCGVEMESEASV